MDNSEKNYMATVTLKSFYSGSYSTKDYFFESKKHFNSWVDKHNQDHRRGKIIGILKQKHM